MVAYGVGIIPLIKLPKAEFPEVTHTWYNEDYGAIGTFANVELYFNSLQRFVLGLGYYPEPTKIIIIMHPYNIESIKRFGLCHGFKLCTDARYLGGFIANDESKRDWIKVRTETWERNISKIKKSIGKYP